MAILWIYPQDFLGRNGYQMEPSDIYIRTVFIINKSSKRPGKALPNPKPEVPDNLKNILQRRPQIGYQAGKVLSRGSP